MFANTSYGQLVGFPIEVFGVFALLSLLILTSTSHDFWMKLLSPPVWKRIHYLICTAYLSVVADVSFGNLQDQQNSAFTVLFIGRAVAVGGYTCWPRSKNASAMPLEGKLAQVCGVVLQRGMLSMLQLRGGHNCISGADGARPAQDVKPLGR